MAIQLAGQGTHSHRQPSDLVAMAMGSLPHPSVLQCSGEHPPLAPTLCRLVVVAVTAATVLGHAGSDHILVFASILAMHTHTAQSSHGVGTGSGTVVNHAEHEHGQTHTGFAGEN